MTPPGRLLFAVVDDPPGAWPPDPADVEFRGDRIAAARVVRAAVVAREYAAAAAAGGWAGGERHLLVGSFLSRVARNHAWEYRACVAVHGAGCALVVPTADDGRGVRVLPLGDAAREPAFWDTVWDDLAVPRALG